MLEIKGNYTNAIIYCDELDEASISQIYQVCNQKSMENCKIVMMPDVHMGSSCCVGTTIQLSDCVIPSLVGVDIGCGMEVVKLRETHIELARLDKFIHQKIPSGGNIHESEKKERITSGLKQLYCYDHIDELRANKSLGTLGGGNHFIEIDKDEDGSLYLIIHSGSRHLGVEVATYYQKLAFDNINGCDEKTLSALKQELKAKGKQHQYANEVKKLKNTKQTELPYLFAYLKGEEMEHYLHDIAIVQEYACLNRMIMAKAIMKYMKLHAVKQFTTIHNYIDMEQRILRKGAISAKKDEIMIIPLNMRDGSLLCRGKGNPDWNYSAPHGAGRAMSRSEAKQSFSLSAYKKEMKDIYSTSVNASTLDECPMAYKNAEQIKQAIQNTAQILSVLKPIYNFKAGKD
ncbi:RtcB family protein [[Eubacterium] hominis]|uniref:RtcB family protein n=1 Tax=[Eubacterium] hominis TaxID=2764325 RepID=UPI003A4DDA50